MKRTEGAVACLTTDKTDFWLKTRAERAASQPEFQKKNGIMELPSSSEFRAEFKMKF
jgi:hypothetical protein